MDSQWIASGQLVIASGQLVIKQIPSIIVIVEQTNISFYTFLIQLEITELAIASYSWLHLVIASDSGQLVIGQTASLILLLSRPNFPFTHFQSYMKQLSQPQLAAASDSQWIASDQLDTQSYLIVEQTNFFLLHLFNQT